MSFRTGPDSGSRLSSIICSTPSQLAPVQYRLRIDRPRPLAALPTACSSFFRRLLSDIEKALFQFGSIEGKRIVLLAAPPFHTPPECLFSLVGHSLGSQRNDGQLRLPLGANAIDPPQKPLGNECGF